MYIYIHIYIYIYIPICLQHVVSCMMSVARCIPVAVVGCVLTPTRGRILGRLQTCTGSFHPAAPEMISAHALHPPAPLHYVDAACPLSRRPAAAAAVEEAAAAEAPPSRCA